MRGSRVIVTFAATGLSSALALGCVTPASAATSAASVHSTMAVSAAKAPFPGKKPAAILAQSVKAAKAASSYHLRVTFVDEGGLTKIDMVIGKLGARGTITDSTGTATVVRVKKTIYLKATASYWTAKGLAADRAKVVAGKWVGLKGNGQTARELLRFTSSDSWASSLATLKPTARVAGKVVAKVPTVGLKSSNAIVYVATKGRPLPLLVTDPAEPRNIMTFTQWNKRVTFKAPKVVTTISR
jgi:hypothetical protein